MLKRFLLTLLFIFPVSTYAQTQGNTHISTGGTLPATCRVGDAYYKTGASAGLYNCSATNTWTLVSPSTVVTAAASLTANQLVIGSGGQAVAALGTLGTTTTLLHGNAGGAPTFGAVSLSADVTGNLPVTNLNSGTGATSSTFWRGDGTWSVAGTGTVTNTGTLTAGKAIIGNGTSDVTVSSATGVAHLSTGTLTGSNVDLATEVTGNLPVGNLNSGTGATATTFWRGDGTWGSPSGTGAPASAQYVTLALDGGLSAERVLTAGTGITITDGGANSTVTIAASSTGAWTQLAQVVTSGSQATVDFTSISGSYTSLKVLWMAQELQGGSSTVVMNVKVNNDGTAGNYTSTSRNVVANGSGNINAIASSAAGCTQMAILNQSGSTGVASTGELSIMSYAGTTFHKRLLMQFGAEDGSGTLGMTNCRWQSTAAITRLTFSTGGTGFLNGSVFTLYGVN